MLHIDLSLGYMCTYKVVDKKKTSMNMASQHQPFFSLNTSQVFTSHRNIMLYIVHINLSSIKIYHISIL